MKQIVPKNHHSISSLLKNGECKYVQYLEKFNIHLTKPYGDKIKLFSVGYERYDECSEGINSKFIDYAYLPTKEGIFMSYFFPHLSHEMAHIVELNKFPRLLKKDWGMPVYDPLVNGDAGDYVLSAAAREQRVVTIENIISNDNCKLEHISNRLNNNAWEVLVKRNLPIGKIKTLAGAREWLDNIREQTFKNWNRDRVEAEWRGRMEYLMNWMETKEENE